jgi:hypothetical protein
VEWRNAGFVGLLAAVKHDASPDKVLIALITSLTSLHNRQPESQH